MSNNIYVHTKDIHNTLAPREVVPLILNLIEPKSVLDVGCGIGTWLKVFEDNGIIDFLGIDGDYVDRGLMIIPENNFRVHDLTTPLKLNRKFDLVISLEVAEHLPESVADLFVKSLINHGDIILFSAAIPGQGGQNHLNEQWPEYWQKKFQKHGFYFHDSIRMQIWNNEKVDWWYRQNTFLIKKVKSEDRIMNVIHPECFNFYKNMLSVENSQILSGQIGVRLSLGILFKALKIYFLKKIRIRS